MAFLDTAGLERLWQQIIAKLGTKADTIHNHNVILEGDVVSGATVFDGDGGIVISTNVTSMHGVKTEGTGAAYTATVDGIESLTAGVSFIMIPHTNSTTTTPTLNVNGLGAKGIRMRGSTATGTAIAASIAAWLGANKPVQITYNGIFWVAEVTRPAATDLSGTVPIASGGTGASTAEDALTNLGAAASSHNHSASDITSGTLAVARGGTGVTTDAAIGLKAYPVGAVYISYVSTSPAELFGGTWTAIKGRFPYFNAGTATGGSNTHTLTEAQMPSHTHWMQLYSADGTGATVPEYTVYIADRWTTTGMFRSTGTSSISAREGATGFGHTYPKGDGGSHNNMPAYQTLYAWRRTA